MKAFLSPFNEACPEGQDEISPASVLCDKYRALQRSLPRRAG